MTTAGSNTLDAVTMMILYLDLIGKFLSTHFWLVRTGESSGTQIGCELSLSSNLIIPRPHRADTKKVHNMTVHGLLATAKPILKHKKVHSMTVHGLLATAKPILKQKLLKVVLAKLFSRLSFLMHKKIPEEVIDLTFDFQPYAVRFTL